MTGLTTLTLKDGNGNPFNLYTYDDGTGMSALQVLASAPGVLVANATPLPVQVIGSSPISITAIGNPTDGKSTATDSTSVSLIALTKEISACIQLLSGALAGTGALRVRPEDSTETVAVYTLPSSISVDNISLVKYETVAASQTAQVLGGTGATGDYISHLVIIPATTSPGAVTLLDNATSIPVFVGGTSSITNLIPFAIPLGLKSVSGALKITTGTNVSVVAVGKFT